MGRLGFQIGWIPYLNLRPMQVEIERLTGQDFDLMSGHPTTVNRWLCEGAVSLAPCSSINLLKTEQMEVAAPVGIASDGAVQSVYIGLHREHGDVAEFIQRRQVELRRQVDEATARYGQDWKRIAQYLLSIAGQSQSKKPLLPKIYFTPASAASAALAKVFFKLWFGPTDVETVLVRSEKSPRQHDFMQGERPLELVIGDEALVRRFEFSSVLDLGKKWLELTGLPFVFAIWQTTLKEKDLPQGVRSLIADAASISAARMRVEPQLYAPDPWPLDVQGRKIDLASYWNAIQYKLTPRHMDGLLLYLTLYATLFECTHAATIPSRLAKWQGQWQDSVLG